MRMIIIRPMSILLAQLFNCWFVISDMSIFAGEARAATIAEALAWIAEHRKDLALKWAELNERD
jgi:hypothetical protein